MVIAVQCVTLADFDTFETYDDNAGGTLIAPLMPLTWPVKQPDDDGAAQRRNAWSMRQQRQQFQTDPTAKFVKAVDTETGEALALARWHDYPEGFKLDYQWMEVDAFAPPGTDRIVPSGLLGDLHAGFMAEACAERLKWMAPGPCWILTTLITRSGYRKRGAGGLLVKWGAQKAQEAGVPAYIEASTEGEPLYRACGFEKVGVLTIDCRPWGLDMDISMSKMARQPATP